jgi:biopolymer transport protein ExbB
MSMWNQMTWLGKAVVIVMFIMSAWSIGVMIDRFLVFGKARRASDAFVAGLKGHLTRRDLAGALALARAESQSPVAKVVESGLAAYKQGREALESQGPEDVGEFDVVDSVNRSLERVKERETSSLRKGLGGLATIASIAPFVGLFGTVLGIITAFQLLKGGGGIDVIGPGIAEALVSTAFGLLVAIPAAMAFNYFTGRVESMVVDMSDVSSEFIDYVLKEGRA